MDIPLAKKVDGKKYLWDGGTYETQEQASQAMQAYEKDGFEVQMFVEEDQYLVYSRRVATAPSAD
ncbi:MAG: hypothetical protein Q8M54_10090 [Desulfobaccales bacterium]|nr:hypothetical protein [Desulfobaccales bacterium]